MAQFLDNTPLTLEFEGAELVKVAGARPDYMDGQSLIRLVRHLGRLSFVQEQEIARYKAEVDDLNAEIDRKHSERAEASYVERRDLFAIGALIGAISSEVESITPAASAARRAYDLADAMEAARSPKEPG